MTIDKAHFIVHYGPKSAVDKDCRETGPLFDIDTAMERGLEKKAQHGKAFVTKRNRKGHVIETYSVVAVSAAPIANAA